MKTLQSHMNEFSYTHGIKMYRNEDYSGTMTMTVLQFPECANHSPKEYYLMFMERLVKNLRQQYEWEVENPYNGKITTVKEYALWLDRMNGTVYDTILYNFEIPEPEFWEVYTVTKAESESESEND